MASCPLSEFYNFFVYIINLLNLVIKSLTGLFQKCDIKPIVHHGSNGYTVIAIFAMVLRGWFNLVVVPYFIVSGYSISEVAL